MDHLALVDQQGQFYRNNFRRLLKFSFFLIFIAFCLVGYILYQQISLPAAKFFVTTTDGRLIEIKPIAPPS
jgi:hypothetical protein